MPDFYDYDGQPISMWEWAALFEARGELTRWRVADTTIGPYRVSTVWLGLDHNWMPGRPLIFETMVFGREPGKDLDCRRYSTAEQALAGHQEVVAEVRLLAEATNEIRSPDA